MNTLAHRLKAALPAGEWEALSFIEQPDGMMANHAWGILGRVRALRHGGIDAFIKFIVSARDGAGDVTKLVTSKARIRRLEERLHSLMGVASLPLVRILECRVLEDPDGLFIAMENVTTIDEMIRSGTANIQLATNVLRTLGGGPGAQSWHHFDMGADPLRRGKPDRFQQVGRVRPIRIDRLRVAFAA